MKTVNRKTFLALPAGTLFSTFTSQEMSGLLIKGKSNGNTFRYWSSRDEHRRGCVCEDYGVGEKEERIVVWSPQELKDSQAMLSVIERLQEALNQSVETP